MQWTRARMVVVLFVMWLAAALAARADAASLYKCSDDEGRVSYQSAPCPPGATQVWERTLAPDASLAPVPGLGAGPPTIGGAEFSRETRGPIRRVSVAPRASPPRKSASRACQSAKAADAAYRAQPLSRVTHDGLRRHGDRIRLACGPG